MAMIEYPDFLFLFLAPFMIFLYRLINRIGKTRSEPTNWPLVGMLPGVLRNLHRAHDYATQVLSETELTYEFKGPCLCNVDMLFTCDPANIHHIFSKNFSNYSKGPEFRKIFEILGDGIFNADYELWEIHRRTTLALLTHADFSSFLERSVWHKVETGLFPVLDHFCEKGSDLDLQDIFQRFNFDNICKVVLDYDPCSLCVELPYIPCDKAFSNSMEPLLHRHILPQGLWKLQKWLKIGKEKKLLEASKAFDEFIYPRVSPKNDQENFQWLRAFEKVYKEKNICPSDGLRDFLKDTSLNLMLAGRDTTSTCLTWLFWLIALNPSAETKILEEMEKELKLEQGRNWRCFSAEESHKLVYLHAALCESLRLFPPVAMEYKSPTRPDFLPSGHYLHTNAKVVISLYSVGRMEKVWGEDCLEFWPERWITPRGGIKHEPSYKFPAFNVGPRTCLGKEMAFVQMKMAAAAILYHYKVRLVEGHPVLPDDSIILQARYGLKVTLSRRNI